MCAAIVEHDPRDVRAHYFLAKAAKALDDLATAEKHLEHCARLDPGTAYYGWELEDVKKLRRRGEDAGRASPPR